MVLVSALLLLVVVTIMAIAMFRSYGIQERISGNVREKQKALHAAETAEAYAEYWLSTNGNATQTPVVCNELVDATLGFGQICSNPPAVAPNSPTNVPWMSGDATPAPMGVSYLPHNGSLQMVVNNSPSYLTTTAVGTYFREPRFYITYLGPYAGVGGGDVFLIDAAGYGTTANSVAVVESTYLVGPEVKNLGGL